MQRSSLEAKLRRNEEKGARLAAIRREADRDRVMRESEVVAIESQLLRNANRQLQSLDIAAQRSARCVPHALHELAAAVLAEATVSNSCFSEGQLRVRLHADEQGRLHGREQLRDRVHG